MIVTNKERISEVLVDIMSYVAILQNCIEQDLYPSTQVATGHTIAELGAELARLQSAL